MYSGVGGVSARQFHYLFGQLFLTEFVESEELPCKDNIFDEPDTGQLDTDDNLPVRHHHSHCTEVDLQIFRQLLTPGIARVLQEETIIWE